MEYESLDKDKERGPRAAEDWEEEAICSCYKYERDTEYQLDLLFRPNMIAQSEAEYLMDSRRFKPSFLKRKKRMRCS